MSVQARIAFFETFASSSSSSTSSSHAASTDAAANSNVNGLVDFFEAFAAAPSTPAPPSAATAHRRTPVVPSSAPELLVTPSEVVPTSEAEFKLVAATSTTALTSTASSVPSNAPPRHQAHECGHQANDKPHVNEAADKTTDEATNNATDKASDISATAPTASLRADIHKSRLPARLCPTRIPVIRPSTTVAPHRDQRPRSTLTEFRARIQTPGSRLLDFRTSPKYLQQVADSKQRRAAALTKLNAPRPFSVQSLAQLPVATATAQAQA